MEWLPGLLSSLGCAGGITGRVGNNVLAVLAELSGVAARITGRGGNWRWETGSLLSHTFSLVSPPIFDFLPTSSPCSISLWFHLPVMVESLNFFSLFFYNYMHCVALMILSLLYISVIPPTCDGGITVNTSQQWTLNNTGRVWSRVLTLSESDQEC